MDKEKQITLKEAIDYFKNRVAFEIPVYDTPQFKKILIELRRLQGIEEAYNWDSWESAKANKYRD